MCQKGSPHMHAYAFMPSPGFCQKIKRRKRRVFFCCTGRAYKKHFSVMYMFYHHEDEKQSKFCPK